MRIRGLWFAYGAQSVFEAFDWEADCRITALRGPSGCGKSTLLRLLAGDLKPASATEFPDSNGAFLILQEDGLFPWLTGITNISELLRWPTETVVGHSLFPLIAPFAEQRAHTLSFGQRRSVELCRALMAKPSCLLLDEPFNYLDPARRSAFAAAIVEASEAGSKVVLSTHYQEDTAELPAAVCSFDGNLPVRGLRRA